MVSECNDVYKRQGKETNTECQREYVRDLKSQPKCVVDQEHRTIHFLKRTQREKNNKYKPKNQGETGINKKICVMLADT